jgi:molybdenum cofactor cytidylyltransferase
MRLLRLDASSPASLVPADSLVCHDVRNPAQRAEVLVRKGSRLGRDDVAALLERGVRELHLAIPARRDIGEDDAAVRLAAAVAGVGVTIGPARFGQVVLRSDLRGLLRVHADQLEQINQQAGVLVMTSPPECAADRGAPLGVVKCAPLFLEERTIEAVEAIRLAAGAAVEVVPFQPHRVAFVAPGERLRGAVLERATTALRSALDWFGSSMPLVLATAESVAEVAAGYTQAVAEGAELILAAGASATDPLDVMFEGLRLAGGRVEQIGIPAEPGTACWIGALGERPVLGLASCELFGRPGALDLLLPQVLSGAPLDGRLLGKIALGGLLLGGPGRVLPYHLTEED